MRDHIIKHNISTGVTIIRIYHNIINAIIHYGIYDTASAAAVSVSSTAALPAGQRRSLSCIKYIYNDNTV